MSKKSLAERFADREEPVAPTLNTPSDGGWKSFVDLNFKVAEPVRTKHWVEAAMRQVSRKKLYLMMAQAFIEKNGSLAEKARPELAGLEALEIERTR